MIRQIRKNLNITKQCCHEDGRKYRFVVKSLHAERFDIFTKITLKIQFFNEGKDRGHISTICLSCNRPPKRVQLETNEFLPRLNGDYSGWIEILKREEVISKVGSVDGIPIYKVNT